MDLIDTVLRFETPEGVELEFHPAGPVPRALAWSIDLSIRASAYMILFPVLSTLGGIGEGTGLLVLFLVEWFYPVLFEVLRGATPGKKAMGLRVIHDNGTPLGWSAGLIRNLLRSVDFLPIGYAFGLVSCLMDKQARRLGDIAAGTLVVYAKSDTAHEEIPQHPAMPPPVPLTAAEQRTLLAFAERGSALSAERREELARLITPLTEHDKVSPPGADTLLGYANWITRGR